MTLSFVIPFFNEQENLPVLLERLYAVIAQQSWQAEVILVDDGSQDGSARVVQELLKTWDHLHLIRLRRNFGQTAAMQAGFEAAKGDVIVTLDADLQNPPEDIPKLIQKIQEGYDVVSGWRKSRQDHFFTRNLPSAIANALIRKVTKVPLNDFGCTLKAYRREILNEFRLYGEMHRFIPVHASWLGAKITEVEVSHAPRIHGESKYGLIRIFKVLLDLLTIKFLGDFSTKPLYLFGGFGMGLISLGCLATLTTAIQKICFDVWVHKNPMILLAVFFLLMGVNLTLIGLLAELGIRQYYESQGRKTYSVLVEKNTEQKLKS